VDKIQTWKCVKVSKYVSSLEMLEKYIQSGYKLDYMTYWENQTANASYKLSKKLA